LISVGGFGICSASQCTLIRRNQTVKLTAIYLHDVTETLSLLKYVEIMREDIKKLPAPNTASPDAIRAMSLDLYLRLSGHETQRAKGYRYLMKKDRGIFLYLLDRNFLMGDP
jgi:cobalamin biosynthesis protein CobD/CbiB